MAHPDRPDYPPPRESARRFFYNEPGFDITNARDVDGTCYKNEPVRWLDGRPSQTSLDILEEHSQSLLTAASLLSSPPFFFMCTRSAFRPSEVHFLPVDEVAAWLQVLFQKGFRFHAIEPLARATACEMKACLIAYLQCAHVNVFLSEAPCAPALPLIPRAAPCSPDESPDGSLHAGVPPFATAAFAPSSPPPLPPLPPRAPPTKAAKAAKPKHPKKALPVKNSSLKKAPKKPAPAPLKTVTALTAVGAAAALQHMSAKTAAHAFLIPRRNSAPPKATESLWKRQRVSPAPPSRDFPLPAPPRKSDVDAPQKRARKFDTSPLSVLAPEAVAVAKAPRKPRKERRRSVDDVEVKERCMKCGMSAKDTPMMRKGPDGCRSMCNACGLRWVRHGVC